jgi:thioredoxin reductase (NADPH)
MPKPVIFTIDDDSSVLSSVERDLRAHYGQNYRILPIDSGKDALDYLKKMQQRNEMVALFLVDQRMPEMSGVEFLEEAIQAYPRAKRCYSLPMQIRKLPSIRSTKWGWIIT